MKRVIIGLILGIFLLYRPVMAREFVNGVEQTSIESWYGDLYGSGDEATILDVADSVDDGTTYTNFGGAGDDTVDELFAAIDGAWPTVLTENAIEAYIFDADAEAISGNWEVQDDVHFSFGNDDDSSLAWDASAVRLEIRNVSDTPIFWFDLVNYSFGVAAVASPEQGLYDVDAAGAARTDEYAGGIGAQQTTTTEDAVVSDFYVYTMLTSKILVAHWDGSDESWIFGDSGTGEDLIWDYETATDNQVGVGTNSGVTEVDFGSIALDSTQADTEFIPISWFVFDGTTDPDIEKEEDNIRYRDFASDATEEGEFIWRAPFNLTGSTIKVQVVGVITNATAPANTEGVSFDIAACSITGNESHDCAVGDTIEVEDTDMDDHAGTQWDIVYIGSECVDDPNAANGFVELTPTGLDNGELVKIIIARDHDDAIDDYGQDFGVIGVNIKYQYTLNGVTY